MYIPPEAMPCRRDGVAAEEKQPVWWYRYDPGLAYVVLAHEGEIVRVLAQGIDSKDDARVLAAAQEMKVALTWVLNNWEILIGSNQYAQVKKVRAKVRAAWEKATYA
jgi:hypothetical protein